MKDKKLFIATIVYAALLAGFLCSNFIYLIGYNYTPAFAISSFDKSEGNKLSEAPNLYSLCNGLSAGANVPAESANYSSTKGFPLATNEAVNVSCDSTITYRDFQMTNPDVLINAAYFILITGGFVALLIRTKKVIPKK